MPPHIQLSNLKSGFRHSTKVRLGPSGLHLFCRETGDHILLDEVNVPPGLWSQAPRHVSVAVTNACDLSCHYCYAPKHNGTIDFDLLNQWLMELDASGCLAVGFGGGEPTLYPSFPALCRAVFENTGLAVTFTTHAHYMTEDLAKKLHGCVHFIRVSMDGVETTYERLRGRSFKAFLNAVNMVRGIARFGVNFVVNRDTLPELDAAVELAFNMGAVEFLLLPQSPVDGISGIDRDSNALLQDWVQKYRGPVPLRVSESGASGLPICDLFRDEETLRSYAHIDVSGVLKRSSFDTEGVRIGPAGVVSALHALQLTNKEE